MDIKTVKHHIKDKKFDKFYIFCGEEGYVIRKYINEIVKATGYDLVYVDSIDAVWPMMSAKSLLPKHCVYVVLDDKKFQSADKNEKDWARVERVIKDDILILEYTKVDARLKFWKFFKNRAVMFDKLGDKILSKYVKKYLPLITDNRCLRLIEICESDLGRLLLESDKIRTFMDTSDYDENKAFDILMKQGVIYVPPKDAIFDFVNAVLARSDISLIFDLLEQSYAVGEANMVLITVLYDNFRNVLQLQNCQSANVAKSTGLNGWQVKNAKPYIDNYSDSEIINALNVLSKVERGIKLGTFPDKYSMQFVLYSILSRS